MKRLSTIGKMCVLCILCLVMVLGLTSCAKDEATKDFNILTGDISQLQDNFSKKIVESETLLSETKAENLADPNLLGQLQSEIDTAKNFSASVPNIASDIDAIKQQIQDMTTTKTELQKQFDSLDSAVSAIKESKKKLIAQIDGEKKAKLQEAITPKDTYSITATDANGNKEKITIKIGKWIKGSETELLDKAWGIVGRSGSMPLTGSYGGDRTRPGGTFHPKDAAYVFGTVSIENMTPDFSAKNFYNGQSLVYLTPKVHFESKNMYIGDLVPLESLGFGNVVQGRQYSSESSCDLVSDGSNPLVLADMTSNTWGPCAFVIGVEDVFTPNYPEGNPKLNDVYFILSSVALSGEGDTKFNIEKSW